MELQFEDIEKSYKDKKVLKGISVTMGTGVYGLKSDITGGGICRENSHAYIQRHRRKSG